MKEKKDKKSKSFHFRGQMPDEEVIEFFRRHWLVLIPELLPFLLYMTGLIVFVSSIGRFRFPTLNEPFFQLLVLLALIGTAFFIHRFFLKMIEYFLVKVIITNFRVIEVRKSLFLTDDKHTIVMKRIQDIQKKQKGIVKNLIKVGELVIIISFADPKIIRNVPTPDYHYRMLNQIRTQLAERDHQTLNKGSSATFSNTYEGSEEMSVTMADVFDKNV